MRPDRNTFIFVAVAVAVGTLLAQFLRDFGTAVGTIAITAFDSAPLSSFFASFKVGSVEVLYGPTLGTFVGVVLAVGLTRILWRHFANPS